MNAKQRILSRLRSARTGSRLPREAVSPLAVRSRPSADECVLRFVLEARALGVECFVESSVSGVHERLATLIEGLRVLSWDSTHLPYETGTLVADALSGKAPRSAQAMAEVGVTGCDVAVAETGSLVLFAAPGRSRAVSLLPPVHVALVERRNVCFSMADLFEIYRDRLTGTAACTVITGPSRTADIELTLTLGIHGPGRVLVIVGP